MLFVNLRLSNVSQEGEEFVAQGYPIDYANAAFAENINEPLLPIRIRGTSRRIPLQAIAQHGFDAPLREPLFAQTDTENRSGKGMSGGIVHAKRDNQIAGMVLACGNFELSIQNQVLERFCGFIFASSNRIKEVLAA